jgi:hypothetical protein
MNETLMQLCDSADWMINETKSSDLGDKRLNKRLGNVLELLSQQPDASIPAKAYDWAEVKAAYRFFDNDTVNHQAVLKPHTDATIERIKTHKVVLTPQDTTELDYSSKRQTKGIGKLHYENHKGVFLHPTLAITPERICLGVLDANFYVRKELGKDNQYQLPIENKESVRWLQGYQLACKVAELAPDTQIVSIADRECDIYEVLAEVQTQHTKADFIIRSSKDRCLKDNKKLRKRLADAPLLGTTEFDIPSTPKRKARHVIQEIRAVNVTLREPYRLQAFIIKDPTLVENDNEIIITPEGLKFFDGSNMHVANINNLNTSQMKRFKKLKLQIGEIVTRSLAKALFPDVSCLQEKKNVQQVTINAVMATEVDVPFNVKPVNWILLTSLPILTTEDCLRVIEYYLCRWQIEIFFKILKDGCKVEELQLQTLDRLTACIGLYLIIAWRILFMTMLGRAYPNLSCTVVFTTDEWQAAYMMCYRKAPPPTPPCLADMIVIVAGFGGFLKRKCDNKPGNKSIWIGLQRIRDFAAGIALQNELNDTCG